MASYKRNDLVSAHLKGLVATCIENEAILGNNLLAIHSLRVVDGNSGAETV